MKIPAAVIEHNPSLKEVIESTPNENRRKLLIELLESPTGNRIMDAPASTALRFHHAKEGGLAEHIVDVTKSAMGLATFFLDGLRCCIRGEKAEVVFKDLLSSIITVALLHDLGKIGDTKGNQYYIPNISEKTQKRSVAEPFKIEKNICRKPELEDKEIQTLLKFGSFSDGECSIAYLAQNHKELLNDLSESEINAILYHDGGYGKAKYAAGYTGKEDFLSIIIHAADMMSSRGVTTTLNAIFDDVRPKVVVEELKGESNEQ